MDSVLNKVKESDYKYLRNGTVQNVDAKYLWLQVAVQAVVGIFMFLLILVATTGGKASGFYEIIMGSQLVVSLMVLVLHLLFTSTLFI